MAAQGLLKLAHSDAFLHKVLSHLRLQDLLVRLRVGSQAGRTHAQADPGWLQALLQTCKQLHGVVTNSIPQGVWKAAGKPPARDYPALPVVQKPGSPAVRARR